jgi:hypothetical protein
MVLFPASSVLKSDVVVLARTIMTSLSVSRELLTRERSTRAETPSSPHTQALRLVRPATPAHLQPMLVMTTTMRTLPTTNSKMASSTLKRSPATHLPHRLTQLAMPHQRRSTSTLPTSSVHYPQQMSRQPLHLHHSSLTARHLARNARVSPLAPVTTHSASRPSTTNQPSLRRTSVCPQQQPRRSTASMNRTTSHRMPLTLSRALSWAPKTCSNSPLACTVVLTTRCSMPAWTHGSGAIEREQYENLR